MKIVTSLEVINQAYYGYRLKCTECKIELEEAIELGDPLTSDSMTVHLCKRCVDNVLYLLEKK
jgi:hypothetical protein